MTAPRPREPRRPPSPPDRLPPRRGGGSSSYTYAVSAPGPAGAPARQPFARHGLVRAARALAAAALLALSGALALPAQAQTTCTVTPGDLWCGTLTIGSSTGPGGASHGYIGAANVGSLSPNTFTHEGSTITVNLFIHNVPLMDDPYLALEMSQAPLSGYNFVLDVGSVSINFAGGETSRNFYDTGVDWSMSAGETVTLRLREAPSENATLSGLVVNDGSMDLALIPAFAPATTSYAAWVPKAVEKVTVTPTTLNPNATIEYLDANGMMLADAGTEDGRQVALAAGENVIQVKVTAQDGIATQTYTVTVTRAAVGPPAAPTGLSATADNRRVALAWNAQASDAVITHHEYRYKTDSDYQDNWKTIPYSAPGGFNEDGFTVTGLDNDTAHTFQLRAVNAGGESDAVESSAVTPSGSGRIVESITMRRYDNQDGEPYGIGDKIVFVVVFSEDAECVDSNTRNVRFNLGSGTKNAEDYAGEGTERWWYEYTVQEGDVDSDGIEIPRGPDALPQSYHASLSCSDPFDKSGIKAQGPFPDRKVDGVYPSLDSAVVDGAELVLTWNETLRGDSVPAAGDFAVRVAGSGRPVSSVVVAGSAVTLTLASAVTAGQTVTVSYTKGTNPLKDLASNDAPRLTGQAVTDPSAPPPPVAFTSCTPNPGDVWCGAVTVGKVATTKGRTLKRGFHATWHAGQNSDGVGELPDRRFVYGPNSYRIDEVTVGAGNMAGFLFLSLDDALPAAVRARLVLHVGGKRFLPSEAHHAGRTDTYHWRGTGLDWSSTSSVTLRLRADLPAAPTGLTAEAPTDTGGLLELNWTAPASALPITGYEVKYWEAASVDEDRLFRTRLTGSADTSMLLYPYLDADTEYKLRVRARNAIGGGEWSAVATARTGAQRASKPIMRLQVVDGSGKDINTVTAGGTFRYRIKLENIHNHHLTFDGGSDSEDHGWGTLGIRGAWAMDFVLDGDPEGSKLTCESESLFLRDFVETSATSGYWEFESPGLPFDADERGPLRLRLGFKCTGRHNGASTEIHVEDGPFDGVVIEEESDPSDGVVDTTSEALLRLGSPNRACLSVENDQGTVTNACGSGEAGARALTAQFESAPAQHDGRKRIKVRVAFSEAPANVDADGVRVEGGRVTSSKRVGGSPQGDAQGRSAPRAAGGAADREVVWEFEIEPSSGEDVTVALDAGRPCEEEGAICTADGRSLSEGIATTVEGPETGPSALTARFKGLPETHDGSRAIRFRVAFSENIGISYRSLREDAFTVSGGRVTGGKRVNGRRDLFEMTVQARNGRGRDHRAAGRAELRGLRVKGVRRDLHQEPAPAAADQRAGGHGARPGVRFRPGAADGVVRGGVGGA